MMIMGSRSRQQSFVVRRRAPTPPFATTAMMILFVVHLLRIYSVSAFHSLYLDLLKHIHNKHNRHRIIISSDDSSSSSSSSSSSVLRSPPMMTFSIAAATASQDSSGDDPRPTKGEDQTPSNRAGQDLPAIASENDLLDASPPPSAAAQESNTTTSEGDDYLSILTLMEEVAAVSMSNFEKQKQQQQLEEIAFATESPETLRTINNEQQREVLLQRSSSRETQLQPDRSFFGDQATRWGSSGTSSSSSSARLRNARIDRTDQLGQVRSEIDSIKAELELLRALAIKVSSASSSSSSASSSTSASSITKAGVDTEAIPEISLIDPVIEDLAEPEPVKVPVPTSERSLLQSTQAASPVDSELSLPSHLLEVSSAELSTSSAENRASVNIVAVDEATVSNVADCNFSFVTVTNDRSQVDDSVSLDQEQAVDTTIEQSAAYLSNHSIIEEANQNSIVATEKLPSLESDRSSSSLDAASPPALVVNTEKTPIETKLFINADPRHDGSHGMSRRQKRRHRHDPHFSSALSGWSLLQKKPTDLTEEHSVTSEDIQTTRIEEIQPIKSTTFEREASESDSQNVELTPDPINNSSGEDTTPGNLDIPKKDMIESIEERAIEVGEASTSVESTPIVHSSDGLNELEVARDTTINRMIDEIKTQLHIDSVASPDTELDQSLSETVTETESNAARNSSPLEADYEQAYSLKIPSTAVKRIVNWETSVKPPSSDSFVHGSLSVNDEAKSVQPDSMTRFDVVDVPGSNNLEFESSTLALTGASTETNAADIAALASGQPMSELQEIFSSAGDEIMSDVAANLSVSDNTLDGSVEVNAVEEIDMAAKEASLNSIVVESGAIRSPSMVMSVKSSYSGFGVKPKAGKPFVGKTLPSYKVESRIVLNNEDSASPIAPMNFEDVVSFSESLDSSPTLSIVADDKGKDTISSVSNQLSVEPIHPFLAFEEATSATEPAPESSSTESGSVVSPLDMVKVDDKSELDVEIEIQLAPPPPPVQTNFNDQLSTFSAATSATESVKRNVSVVKKESQSKLKPVHAKTMSLNEEQAVPPLLEAVITSETPVLSVNPQKPMVIDFSDSDLGTTDSYRFEGIMSDSFSKHIKIIDHGKVSNASLLNGTVSLTVPINYQDLDEGTQSTDSLSTPSEIYASTSNTDRVTTLEASRGAIQRPFFVNIPDINQEDVIATADSSSNLPINTQDSKGNWLDDMAKSVQLFMETLRPGVTGIVEGAVHGLQNRPRPRAPPSFEEQEDENDEGIALNTTGMTERIMSRTPVENQATGAGGASTWAAFQRVEENWKALKEGTLASRTTEFVTDDGAQGNPLCWQKLNKLFSKELDYDVVVCGGTLGIFFATALCLKGHKVAVLEAGKLLGREQEWNLSLDELLLLVRIGVLTQNDIDAVVTTEFPGCRSGFKNKEVSPLEGGYFENGIGYECFTGDVLNLGITPSILLERAAQRFRDLGGVIMEERRLQGVVVSKSRGAAVDLGPDVEPVTTHLVLDCMGNASPISRQQRRGMKPDGVCAVVGSCASGFAKETNTMGDIIYTNSMIQDKGEHGMNQYFWEAFPVGIGRNGMEPGTSDTKTTYMFTYMDANVMRPSLETFMEDYWRLLPKYQPSISNPETDLDVKRVLFAYFPTYRNSPLKPQWNRMLAVGDASGIQSPLSFGGLGAMTRHLERITTAVSEALEQDLLDKDELGMINAYFPNLSASWMFQKAMSVRIGQKTDPKFMNRLLATNFEVMDRMGQRTIKPFLQDVVRFDGLVGSLARSFVADPAFMPAIVKHVGIFTLAEWLAHVSCMGIYSLLDTAATPLIRAALSNLQVDARTAFHLRRRMEAWKFGSGRDYILPPKNKNH